MRLLLGWLTEESQSGISAPDGEADKSFDETILELLDIATQIEYIFEKSQNIELKRLLLKFVFEKLTLNEGKLNYKLKFPFNLF